MTTTSRGYGSTHQKLRKQWTPVVNAGGTRCARCGQLIEPGSEWDLGHTDDRRTWTGPEHSTCNRSAGGRNGRAAQAATRRVWPGGVTKSLG